MPVAMEGLIALHFNQEEAVITPTLSEIMLLTLSMTTTRRTQLPLAVFLVELLN